MQIQRTTKKVFRGFTSGFLFFRQRGQNGRSPIELPQRVRSLIADAEASIIRYRHQHGLEPTTFIAADYDLVYRTLAEHAEPGACFLEWGSGIGAITIMAEMLGFHARGIEIEEELVEEAVELAERHGSVAEFVAGSFVPEEYDWSTVDATSNVHTDPGGIGGYDDLEMPLEDFDVIYAYPWPGEDPFFFDIFQQCARPGALFVTYHGMEGMQVTRKPLEEPED